MKSMISAVKDMFKHYFNWHGRLSRAGYWWGWLGITLISFILNLLANFVEDDLSILVGIWSLATFFPLLFAAMRRYHDSGKPGWLAVIFNGLGTVFAALGIIGMFIGAATGLYYMVSQEGGSLTLAIISFSGVFLIISLVLSILNLVFLLLSGTPGENAYGMPRPFNPDED